MLEEERVLPDSRTRIIDSAIELFAAKGFNGVATADIAKDAGMSEAMVFKLFKSKKGLLHAVLEEIVGKRLPAIFYYKFTEQDIAEMGKGNIESLKSFIKSKFINVHEHVKYLKILFMEMQYHEDIRTAYIEGTAPRLVETMSGLFDLWKQAGIVRKDLDSRTAIRSLAGMMNFAILDKNIIKRDMDLEAELDKVWDIYFRGVMVKGDAE